MSITPNVIDPRRATPPSDFSAEDPAAKRRKRVYVSFGASAGLVLLFGVCYIAVRIFDGSKTQAATSKPIRIASVATTPPVRTTTLTPPPVAPSAASPVVTDVTKVAAQVIVPQVVKPAIPAAKPAIPAPAIEPKAVPVPSIKTAPVAVKEAVKETGWTAVTPEPGEYLQVIALPESMIGHFVDGLRSKGLRPMVAISPLDGIYRVLFGAYANSTAREEGRQLLEANGLKPMLQTY